VESSPEDRKKATCKGLTNVLKASRLSETIDPKAFYMMLNTNYSVLAQADGLDLGPLFEALKSGTSEEDLTPLFLAFEEKSRELGVPVKLPPTVALVPADQREAMLTTFWSESEGEPEITYSGLGDDLPRRVVQSLVQGLRASPVGQQVDGSKLVYWLDGNIGQFFDGQVLNATSLVGVLRESGVSDDDLFVGLHFAREKLKALDVTLPEPPLSVPEERKPELIQEAKRRRAPSPRPRPTSAVKEPTKTEQETQARLEDLGLGVERTDPKRRTRTRLVVLMVVAVLLGVTAFLFRPDRPLSTSAYRSNVPLVEAELKRGAFAGVLDVEAWRKVPPQEREDRVQAFATTIRSQGLLKDLQVRTPEGELVVVTTGGKIKMSPKYLRSP
jgi:hypothetical protein